VALLLPLLPVSASSTPTRLPRPPVTPGRPSKRLRQLADGPGAHDAHECRTRTSRRSDPLFAKIRTGPRWAPLMARMKDESERIEIPVSPI
jgi:hypothetical protein